MCCCFYYYRKCVLFKIHAASIEGSKFLLFLVVDGKLFLKVFQMLVICIIYVIVTTFIIFLSFASEGRVARNTILIQREVLWTGKI